MRLEQLSSVVQARVVRDGQFDSLGLIAYRDKPRMLVFLEQERYLDELNAAGNVAAVICSPSLADKVRPDLGVAVCDRPRSAFFGAHNYLADEGEFYPKLEGRHLSSSSKIHPRACIPDDHVHIGENSVIEANVTISSNTHIGDGVTIRAGTVIGSDGFQFIRADGEILSVRHAGGVWIERGVEIQSNCCVDRSIFGGYTTIGEFTKIGQLSLVAHNTVIGKRCLIAPHAMISGSAIMGDDLWLGPAVTISSSVRVGDGASLTIGSVATRDISPAQKVSGNFAIDHQRFVSFIRSIR